MKQLLILAFGFVGGTAGVMLDVALVGWLAPLLGLKASLNDEWVGMVVVALLPVVWIGSAMLTMGWAMRQVERFRWRPKYLRRRAA